MAIAVFEKVPASISLRGHKLLIEFDNLLATDGLKSLGVTAANAEFDFHPESLVHSLIERQAIRTPNAISLEFETQRGLSYRELNETANAVARQLVCGRGSIVPIAVSRSINLVIALLAVLKAGAAYVLLSPDAPMERNRFIIADTKATFVIVDDSTRGWFKGTEKTSIETLVAQSQEMPSTLRKNLNIYQESLDIAYVIYTSGTTGYPKGVLLSHNAACIGLSALPPLDPSQPFRQLLCHSPNFSAAQRTILGTLSRGGTLCLASKESITLQLNETVEQMRISSLEITPSMLKLIDPSMIPETVKKITLGGEPVGPALVELWAARVELFSAYGLSECTQLNFRHQLEPGKSSRIIGRPSDSTTYHVLALNSTQPVLPMEPGELCLGGSQLAEGYLNLPEKTGEVFINNPFGPGRLYRTGDMVIANGDGTIELIGRIDQQTKIDGVVTSCVVSALIHDRKALVAHIVPESGREWTSLVRELRSKLRTQIPSSAVPRYWVRQENMPLNVSGKADIASLVKAVESMEDSDLITPSTTSPDNLANSSSSSAKDLFELEVAEVIAGVLSISLATVDLETSFQELGGSSLDAIIVSSKLRKINIHITVPDILQSSSIRELSTCRKESIPGEVAHPQPLSLLPDGLKLNLAEYEDAYPVTPLQEGILADSILGKVNYVYQRIYRIKDVTPSQIRAAMETVIARNTILRTSFLPWKRSFLQVVKPKVNLPWKTVRGKPLESFLRSSAKNAMPLDGPLIRVAILDNELLVLEMHHALFDFWSSQFIVGDTIEILQGKDRISRLPFNNYVAYQQRMLNENFKNFWKSYLDSAAPSILDLQKGTKSNEPEKPFVVLSNLGNSLSDLSQALGVTVGTVLHAAWALTLSSQLNSADVTFMTAFSGRDADIDGILDLNGPTLCTVPMRVHIDDAASIIEFTKSVQTSIKPGTFNSMVNILVKLPDFPGNCPLVPVQTHSDNFTQYVTIEIDETDPNSVKLLVPFGADHDLSQGILDRFGTIINYMAAKPNGLVSKALSQNSDTQEINQDGLGFANATPQFGLAHSAFESLAISTPNKIAIRTSNGRTLSYSDLNVKANGFASWLISQGVRHEEMIPLYMEKSAETIISILGILKAGASFTPLDPRNPHDRNAFIVKDVGAVRIVSDRRNREACSSFGVPLIIPEAMDLTWDGDQNVTIPELTPQSTIYAIYTSGSTGLPKGVLVQHSAVTASTKGMIEATNVTSEWNSLWVLNYVFDASYYDVFTIFSTGATLCLAPQDELLSNLAGYINDMEIEQVMLTPTITKLISGGPAQVPHLKVLNVCGERIDVNILEWAKSLEVYNGYGPTEATILMTVSRVEPDGNLNSIGLPLKHAVAIIIPSDGSSLEIVLRGTVGELCVRGPHLAKGYINRPDQTKAAFVQDVDGEPLYRTGDLARWAEDGTLECLGRKDYQIKLNGFRIELGEIENAILRTGEADAAVVCVAEVHGKHQLVAFCIFKGDYQPGSNEPLPPGDRLERVSELMSKLTTISHYMMPALFLPFRSFPTLPSGKANRKGLTTFVESMQKAEITQYIPLDGDVDEFLPVSTNEERVMQQAWASVLDEPEESIGANSVFLSLGGDSISAINVVSACRKLSYNISVSDILSSPTLAEQAKCIRFAQPKETAVEVDYEIPEPILSAITVAGIDYDQSIEDIYPCGPGQNEFLTQGCKKQQFWNLTACRELPLDFDIDHWKKVTTQLTERNQIMRATYFQADRADDSSWYQIILKEATLNFEQILYTTESEKIQYMENLHDSPFLFGKANIKYQLFCSLVDGSRTLCIKVDHGSYDGTLLRIFDDQFTAIASNAEDIPPVHSFKQYIDWIYNSNRSEALQYWKDSLSTYSPSGNFLHEPVADRIKFAPVHVDVDKIASMFSVTASTVFQAAYSLVAGRLNDTKDVLVDNLITGRNADVENPQLLNGTCANFLPFRSQLSETNTIEQFLKDTQATFWDTTEHGTVGLNDIYNALGTDRQTHSAKMLYCFQPFDPAPFTTKPNPMRWLVMAQSKVYMTINYAIMVEVQKTLKGYRFKLQWDSKALSNEQLDELVVLFNAILEKMAESKAGKLDGLMNIETTLKNI